MPSVLAFNAELSTFASYNQGDFVHKKGSCTYVFYTTHNREAPIIKEILKFVHQNVHRQVYYNKEISAESERVC